MALGKQIKFYREKKGMSLTRLAELVSDLVVKNVEPGTIRAIEERDSQSSKYAKPIAEIFGMTVEQLMDETRDYIDNPVGDSAPSYSDFAPIPIINARAACGNGYINDNVEVQGNFAFPRQMLQQIGVNPKHAEIIFAYSYSMFPTIRNGSHVMINKSDKELREGKIYAVCLNGELVLKRLFCENGVWLMRSDNPDKNEFPDRPLPNDDRAVVYGRVVWCDNVL